MTPQEHARLLLEEWNLCSKAKPKNNAVDIQLEKDTMKQWVSYLVKNLTWGSDIKVQEACNQFESRLKNLKEKLVLEILTNGTI